MRLWSKLGRMTQVPQTSALLASTFRSPPPGMTKLDLAGFKASCLATNLDWDSFRPSGGKALYVDPLGSDSASGDIDHPFRSLLKAQAAALADASVTTVYVNPGLYRRIYTYTVASSPHQSLAWIANGGAVTIANIEEVAEWTQNETYPTVWQTARSSATQVCSLDMLEVDGITPKRLVKKTTLANCAGAIPEGTAGHWYTDGTDVYVQMPDGLSPVDPAERVYVSITATSVICLIYAGTTQHWDGFDFFGTFTVVGATAARSAVFRDCTFRRGATNCISTSKITHCYFKDCLASYAGSDGFNVHFSDETDYTRAVFENCIANVNGTSGDIIDNGFTVHEGAAAVLVNCTANGSHGNVNAHVNASQVWALGCQSNNSYVPNYAGWQIDGEMWLDTCTSTGCTYDRTVAAGGKLHCYKFTGDAGADSVADGATLDEYVPTR